MRMMGGGKLGMMIGAPDVVQSVNNDFKGKFEDYGVTAVPESEGKASLSGGDGYMFNPKATPEKIKAGLLWLEFHELTPGKGQFNYARSKAQGRPVGLPIPDLYGDSAPGKEIVALRKQYATVPVDHFTPYVDRAVQHHQQARAAEGAGAVRRARRGDVRGADPQGRRHRQAARRTPRARRTRSWPRTPDGEYQNPRPPAPLRGVGGRWGSQDGSRSWARPRPARPAGAVRRAVGGTSRRTGSCAGH